MQYVNDIQSGGEGDLIGLQPTTAVQNIWKWRKAKHTMFKLLHASNLYKTGFEHNKFIEFHITRKRINIISAIFQDNFDL
jgi:hypothetical protein